MKCNIHKSRPDAIEALLKPKLLVFSVPADAGPSDGPACDRQMRRRLISMAPPGSMAVGRERLKWPQGV
jgi:hypothetical protein